MEIGPKVGYGAWVLCAVSLALFLGLSTSYFGGNSAGVPESFTRSVGIPGSPWLIAHCSDFEDAVALSCNKWAFSFKLVSWSWLALALALGSAARLWLNRAKSRA